MVVSNPVPPDLQGRPFSEQARALPARAALEAFFAAAAGFTEGPGPSAGSTFLRVLERVASEIFRGDTLLQVRGFSPGQQMDYVGRAVHQLVRENYLQLVDFPVPPLRNLDSSPSHGRAASLGCLPVSEFTISLGLGPSARSLCVEAT